MCKSLTSAVCIITPVADTSHEDKILKEYFEEVTDFSIINIIQYYFTKDINKPRPSFAPFNYYESPCPTHNEIERYKKCYESLPVEGIDLNIMEQIKMLLNISDLGRDYSVRMKMGDTRFTLHNPMYSVGDALVLYSMIRHYKPRKIIEIGSGYSTAVMLDAIKDLNEEFQITCIDPRDDRLRDLITVEDNIRYERKQVQDMDIEYFDALES